MPHLPQISLQNVTINYGDRHVFFNIGTWTCSTWATCLTLLAFSTLLTWATLWTWATFQSKVIVSKVRTPMSWNSRIWMLAIFCVQHEDAFVHLNALSIGWDPHGTVIDLCTYLYVVTMVQYSWIKVIYHRSLPRFDSKQRQNDFCRKISMVQLGQSSTLWQHQR